MTLASYDERYRTGFKWLGNVPAHWKVGRFRHLFRESPEKIDKDVVGVMLSVSGYRGVEIKEYDDENRRRLDEELVNYRIVRVGQLVVNSMWLNAAGLGVSMLEGHVSPAYRCYWIEGGLDLTYVHYLLRSAAYVDAYTSMVQGIRPNSLQLSRTDLMNLPVLIPPLPEQKAIATFLDRETATIDALVAEQRRLIELLKEKRQAVISHAVTKGLDSTVPMKDSGIQWLGKVPEHWRLVKLKLLAQIGNGSTPDRKNLSYWTSGTYPWLNSSVVNQREVTEAEQFVTQAALDECHLPKIQPPAVLVGITGQGRTRGMATILRFESTINQHVAYVTPRDEGTSVSFIHRFFQMAYANVRDESDGVGSTKGAITCRQLEQLKMPLPPEIEQQEITQYLDVSTATFDSLEAEAERAIALLQERRTALVSAAVTGKIDVREFAGQEAA